MHEQDAPRGRMAEVRGFVPRLVGGGASVGAQGGGGAARAARPAPVPHSELTDPAVREIADSLTDLFLGGQPARAMDGAGSASGTRVDAGGIASGRAATPGRAAAGEGRSGSARTTPAAVELIVLGHLPVLGGAWVTQYASQAATSLGRPVGLVRLDPEGLTIDVLGLARDAALERAETVEDAMRVAGGLVGRWLVRVDELSEATLAESSDLGAITVLSGVSQTSIVAAYRALKSIAQRRGASGERGEDQAGLNIALLGATAERAADASARVRKAAGTFLGRPVGVMVCGERIGQTGARVLYRGRFDGDWARLLGLIRGGEAGRPAVARLEGDAVRGDAGPGEAGAWDLNARVGGRVDDEDDLAWFLEGEAPVTRAESVARAHRSAEADGGSAGEVGDAPAVVGNPEAPGASVGVKTVAGDGVAAPAEAMSSGLASVLHLTGVPLRCPEAPGVELAVDGQGMLHAIALDDLSTCETVTVGGGRVGVAGLLATDAWVRSNFGLIARAMPFVKDGPVCLHLVTRVPAASRELLGTRIRVHLLARATGAGEVCVPLN